MNNNYTPTLLLIIDGWGIAPAGSGNAVSLADVPNMRKVLASESLTKIECSGRAVGLPKGYMGNSEVGHTNIGAGRVVYQDMTRIDMAIENNELGKNPVIADLFAKTKAGHNGKVGRIHFMGLISDSGVHSHLDHLLALLALARAQGLEAVVHCFMDGRDSPPSSGAGYIGKLLEWIEKNDAAGSVRIGSLIGRYYAMDRDKRWERTKLTWDCLVHGIGEYISDPVGALQKSYAADETDEFIKPRTTGPESVIRSGDSVFFFNFRADRARQLSEAFGAADFDGFDVSDRPDVSFATMTMYDSQLPVPAAFTKQNLSNTLGEEVSKAGLEQLRIAETEKYAHVTYFFNCGREEPFTGEERRLVASPRDVATYDLKPEMCAGQVTDILIEEWKTGRYSLCVCNLANCDMVGHTGIIAAGIKACEAVDVCLGKILAAVAESGGRIIVTSDHGNAEEMLTPDGKPFTSHTQNLVPLVLLEYAAGGKLLPPRKLVEQGKLGDIAVTILDLWQHPLPAEMDGKSLLRNV